MRRVRQAFVASASLRPMAQQLLQDRTPSRLCRSRSLCAPSLAKKMPARWPGSSIGYAHTLDHDYAKAIDPLNRAKAGASELGDYVAYYLGDAYLKTGHNAEALSALADFSKKFPDSLLIRDAHLVYANALLDEGRAAGGGGSAGKRTRSGAQRYRIGDRTRYEAAGEKQKARQRVPQRLLQPAQQFRSRRGRNGIAQARNLRVASPNAARAPICYSKPSTTATRRTIIANWWTRPVRADRPELQLALAGAL